MVLKNKLFFGLFLLIMLNNLSVYAQVNTSSQDVFSWTKVYMDEARLDENTQTKIIAIINENEVKLKKQRITKSSNLETIKKENLENLEKTIINILNDTQKDRVEAVKMRVKNKLPPLMMCM